MSDTEKLSAYQLASRLVSNGVVCNVCGLVQDLSALMQDASTETRKQLSFDEDDLDKLMQTDPDYEEAATQEDWVMLDDADHVQFWATVFVKDSERSGSYEDACTARSWELASEEPSLEHPDTEYEYTFERVVAGGEVQRHVITSGGDSDEAWKALATLLGYPEQEKFETDEVGDDAWEELCEHDNIDAEDYRREVYEHYVVQDWFGRKLAAQGEAVAEIGNLTIWGRTCTGQSVAMDHNIQQMAISMWPDEYNGSEM